MNMEITCEGGKKVVATFENRRIVTDQSVENGGEGSAPEPFMLFLASLGTCAGIYVYNFCHAREIPTDNVKLNQSIFRNDRTRLIEKIEITIFVPSDFPKKYHKPVMRSANMCAVKKHLSGDIEVETRVEVVD